MAVYDGDVFHASLNDADIVRRQSAEFRKFFSGIAGFDSCGANISSKPHRGLGALDFCQFMWHGVWEYRSIGLNHLKRFNAESYKMRMVRFRGDYTKKTSIYGIIICLRLKIMK